MPLWIKTVAIFFTTALLFRVMGRKALTKMSNYDLTVVLIITEVLAEPLLSRDLMATVYSAVLLTALYLLVTFAVLKLRLVRWIAIPRPHLLIARGQLDAQALARARLTLEEFLGQVRLQGYTGPQEVEWALLEPDGQMSFIPKAAHRAVQPPDLHLKPQAAPTLPLQIASDGQHNPAVLHHIGKDEVWLRTLLRTQGVEIQQVFEALVDDQGGLWLYLRQPVRLIHLPKALSLARQLFDTPFPAQS